MRGVRDPARGSPMTPKKLDKLGHVMRVLSDEIDESTRQCCDVATKAGHTVQCKPGCAGCCHMLLTCYLVEAIDLVRCVMANGRATEFGANPDRMVEDLAAVIAPGMTTSVWFDKRRRCAFLGSDDQCMAYESRPQVCREYYAISDPAQCFARSKTRVAVVNVRGQFDRFWPDVRRVSFGFGIPEVYAPLPYLLPLAVRWVSGYEREAIAILKKAGADNERAWVDRWSQIELQD